jgi:hypothetical protein
MILKFAMVLLVACDPALTRLFTPPHPQLGQYEVCTVDEPIEAVAGGWAIDTVTPLDVFGTAGTYDRARLARLFAGRRARVARGWHDDAGRFESVTLISPHPDPTLTRLEWGTMVIRWRWDRRTVTSAR